MKLFGLYSSNKLKSLVDNGTNSEKGPFKGLASVFDAIDYLFSKKSVGKIIVDLTA